MAKKKNKLAQGYCDANTGKRILDANIVEDSKGWKIVPISTNQSTTRKLAPVKITAKQKKLNEQQKWQNKKSQIMSLDNMTVGQAANQYKKAQENTSKALAERNKLVADAKRKNNVTDTTKFNAFNKESAVKNGFVTQHQLTNERNLNADKMKQINNSKEVQEANKKMTRATYDENLAQYKYNAVKTNNEKSTLADKTIGNVGRALKDLTSSFDTSTDYRDENGNRIFLPSENQLKHEKVQNDTKSTFGKVLQSVAYEGTKILGTSALNSVTGGIGGTALYYTDMATDKYQDSYNKTQDKSKSLVNAAINTGLEYVTGKFLGSATKGLTGGKASRLETGISDLTNRLMSKIGTNKMLSNFISNSAGKFASEGAEEFFQEYLQNITDILTLGSNDNGDTKLHEIFVKDGKLNLDILGDAFNSGFIGGLTGSTVGIADGTTRKVSSIQNNLSNFRTQLEESKSTAPDSQKSMYDEAIKQVDNALNHSFEFAESKKQQQALENNTQDVRNKMLAPIKENVQNKKLAPVREDIQNGVIENITRTSADTYFNNTDEQLNKTLDIIDKIKEKRSTADSKLEVEFNSDAPANGMHITEENNRKIVLNPKSDNYLEQIFIHELAHDFENQSTYKELSEYVQSIAKQDGTYESSRESLTEAYKTFYEKNGLDFSTVDMDVETTNDMVSKALGNQEYLNRLAGEKPTLFKKVYDYFKNVIFGGNLKELGTRIQNHKELTKIQNMFETAYNEHYVKGNNEVKFVMKDSKVYGRYWEIETNKDLFKNITSDYKLIKTAYNYLLNGNKNFEEINDVIDNKTIKFVRVSANEYTRGTNSELLSKADYNKKMRMAPSIDDLINNAEIKYPSPLTHKSTLFKAGFNNYQGQLKIDDTVFRYIIRVGKAKNDNIFYDISLKNLGTEKGTDTEVPSVNNTSLLKNKSVPLSENNISQTNKKVNNTSSAKYSIQENQNDTQNVKDNRGRTLSKDQQEYFKDSKVRDKEGNILTVYHGTDKDFNTFTYDFMGKNEGNALGQGHYFTFNKNRAESYGLKTKEAYLNITKPFDLYGDVELLPYAEDLMLKYDVPGIEEWAKQTHLDYVESKLKTNYRAINYLKSLAYKNNITTGDILKELGYDGIVADGDYVVFDSNQIKNVDNMNPTSNEDIRYSQNNNEWQEYLDKNWDLDKDKTKTLMKDKLEEKKLAPVRQDIKELKNEIIDLKKQLAPVREDVKKLNNKQNEIKEISDDFKREITNKTRNNMKDKNNVEFVSIDSLMPYKESGGYRTDEEYNNLSKNIKLNGITNAIEVVKTGDGNIKIINGNHRLEVANELGLKEVPIKYVKDFTLENRLNKSYNKDINDYLGGNESVYTDSGIEKSEISNDKMQFEYGNNDRDSQQLEERRVSGNDRISETMGRYNDEPSSSTTSLQNDKQTKELDNSSFNMQKNENNSNKNSIAEEKTSDEVLKIERKTYDLNNKISKAIENNAYKSLNIATKSAQQYIDFNRTERQSFKEELSKYAGMTKEEIVNAKNYNEIRDVIEKFANRQYDYIDEELKSVKNDVRNRKIAISSELKNQITDYNDFRKSNFGKLKLGNDGMSVDSLWEELSFEYPQYFDNRTTNQADMLYALSDFMNQEVVSTQNYRLTDEDISKVRDRVFNILASNSLSDAKLNEIQLEIEKAQEKKTRKVVREQLLQEMGLTIDDIQIGKDIASLNLQVTAPARVNEKVFGWKTGQKINDATVNQVKHNEAERTRFLNKERSEIKDLGIRPRTKESAAVQKYAEKKYMNREGEYIDYGDSELAKEFPEIKTQEKIKYAAKILREKYDTYIDSINEVLEDMGYDKIPKRDNYMHHFYEMTDKFSQWGIPFNKEDMNSEDLPTDINGITDEFKPGKNWFAATLERKGLRTSYDAITGIDKYLEGASNLIFHTKDIQRYRALSTMIRETYGQQHGMDNEASMTDEERKQRKNDIADNKLSRYVAWLDRQADNLAGKKAKIDRSIEIFAGRRAYTLLNTLKSQVGSNVTGFNVRSAFTNFASVVSGASRTNKLSFLEGTVSTLKNIFFKDNLIDKSDFLTTRFGSDTLSKKVWQKVSNAGQIFMSGTDYFTANQIWRGKYFENLHNGMDEKTAIKQADDFAARIMGDRSKGMTPELYNSKMLGILSQFQLEVNNYWENMTHDNKIELKKAFEEGHGMKVAGAMVFQLGTMFAASYMFNNLMKSLTGTGDVLFDPIDLFKTLMGSDDDDDKTLEERAINTLEKLTNTLPYTSIFNGGRVPISSANPFWMLYKKYTGQSGKYGQPIEWNDIKDDMIGSSYFLLLPGGGSQIKKAQKGASMYDEKLPIPGSYTKSGNLRFEADDSNWGKLKSFLFGQYASKQSQDYVDRGYSSVKSDKIDEMKKLDMTSSQYTKFKSAMTKAMKTQDSNKYYKYLDDSGKTYWYDKDKDVVYDDKYKKSRIDIDQLSKAKKKELLEKFLKKQSLTSKQKEYITENTFKRRNK